MKKTVCLLLAGLMTIGALTGCGSSADDKKDDSAKTVLPEALQRQPKVIMQDQTAAMMF